jgi:hypothetical protein
MLSPARQYLPLAIKLALDLGKAYEPPVATGSSVSKACVAGGTVIVPLTKIPRPRSATETKPAPNPAAREMAGPQIDHGERALKRGHRRRGFRFPVSFFGWRCCPLRAGLSGRFLSLCARGNAFGLRLPVQRPGGPKAISYQLPFRSSFVDSQSKFI